MIDRRLETLRAVHHHGTLTAAADALHLTPSAVSQQLRHLARELDVELFVPEGRRVRLTNAALSLVSHTDRLVAQWERAKADLANGNGAAGSLRVGGFPSAIVSLIAPAMRHLRDDSSRVRVLAREVDGEECIDLLMSDAIDIAVTVPSPAIPTATDERFDQKVLLVEPQDLIVATDHTLASRQSVALAEVADQPWVVAAPGSCDQYHLVHVACAAAGYVPTIAHHAKNWDAVAALVSHSASVALFPRLSDTPLHLPLVRIPVSGQPLPTRQLLIITRRGAGAHPTVAHGIAALQRQAADAQTSGRSAPT